MRVLFFSVLILVAGLYIAPAILADEQLAMVGDSGNAGTDTYPHIGALENAILGQTYPAQPLPERLGRMEKKAFGTVSTKPDLSDRTDDLDDYSANKLHKNLLQANMDVDATDSTSSNYATDYSPPVSAAPLNAAPENGAGSQGLNDYPHVTELEQAILGQTYVDQPLADRLSRMEEKAFGKASVNTELADRTDALETYAEKKLHKLSSSRVESESVGGAGGSQQSGGMFSKVGQALLGMAGGSALNSMMGNSFGGLGPNFGGMGSSAPGSGFGGINVRRRQASDQQPAPEPTPPKRQEDPAVYQPGPPDPNARLIVKVGWCEVKLFGHTFPTMHLPERLGQINNELKLEHGKSDIQLMDDIGLMIKTVQSRKPVAPAVPTIQP